MRLAKSRCPRAGERVLGGYAQTVGFPAELPVVVFVAARSSVDHSREEQAHRWHVWLARRSGTQSSSTSVTFCGKSLSVMGRGPFIKKSTACGGSLDS